MISATKQHMLTALGVLMLCLGLLGAMLPLLPTTPFLLVAVACFSRSLPRVEAWLVDHPRFGPQLRAWREKGAISSRAKAWAALSMAASYAVFLATGKASLLLQCLVAAVLILCLTFILTRPGLRDTEARG